MRTCRNRINVPLFPNVESSVSVPMRILVPIDFSRGSDRTLAYAMRLAEQSNGKILLVHVLETLPLQAALGYVPQEIKKADFQLVRQADSVLTRLAEKTLDPHIRHQVLVRIGVPYQMIVEVARTSHVDLIVLTAHGRSPMNRVFFGSTAERVIRHAPCAVLVLPA